MKAKELFSRPLSAVREWIAAHDNNLPAHLCWALGGVFLIIAVVKLFSALGLL